jgi:predicted enzyme related to lactoylglutathione lyase
MAPHGIIVWNELTTSDLERAKSFYAATMGWAYEEILTPAGPYTLARHPDQTRPVAGLVSWPSGEVGADDWFAYASVDDIDVAISTVTAAGGRAAPAFEVPGVGRFAVLTDPNGASLGLMQRFAGV